MDTKHITQLIVIIVYFGILTLVFKGWGQFALNNFNFEFKKNNSQLDLWFGILILIGVTELINYFIPIEWKISVAIFFLD